MKEIRLEIDRIDDQIISLLQQRLNLVLQLIDQKKTLHDGPRESEILAKTSSKYIQSVYREIFNNSKQMLLDRGFLESDQSS
ncbi:MAG: Chorismate mutase protein [Parachlamydiales bacterium]|nr:Chorismate mutase protein [Parachlamydiales bacterium]